MEPSLKVRDAVETDVEGIMRVHLDCIRKVCAPYYTQDQVEHWTERQSLQRYASFIKQNNKFIVVLRKDGINNDTIVAFGHMGKDIKGIFSTWVDFELYGFYVSPDNLRKGIGKLLLGELAKRALEQGGSGVGVVSTLNAVPFYEACEFELVGSHFHGELQLESRIMERKLRLFAPPLPGSGSGNIPGLLLNQQTFIAK